ncbi:MAG: Asp-tRNA(Asn)/Glu-tRNA(Gln) amidotransferase subunit GatC, partial [Planctomycetota bacterium]|nr:Asp-tRNA(Asn)/Glu-tRNA(Gln) amidotransferase subunit GatC [Planctomycetota bacterium]
SREGIEDIAHLARLDLKGDTLEAMIVHMDKIVQAVSTLSELDTEDVEPYHSAQQPQGALSALRDDIIRPSLSKEDALLNAPAKGPDGFEVPAIHD